MPFYSYRWLLIPQLQLCIFPSAHFVASIKSNIGDLHKSSVVQEIRLFSEPVTNSLVVPVNSEGSLLALIKFSEFIFSPGIGVTLAQVIILFVCQPVIFCYRWRVAALHPVSVVSCHLSLHYLATHYSVCRNSRAVRRVTLWNRISLLRPSIYSEYIGSRCKGCQILRRRKGVGSVL